MSGEQKAIAAPADKYPNADQVKKWKTEFGGVFLIKVTPPDGGDDKQCWIRKPSRKDLARAMKIGKKDDLRFNEDILTNCWLAGDEEIKTNDDLFLGASSQLDEVVQFAEASVKKL